MALKVLPNQHEMTLEVDNIYRGIIEHFLLRQEDHTITLTFEQWEEDGRTLDGLGDIQFKVDNDGEKIIVNLIKDFEGEIGVFYESIEGESVTK